MFEWGIRFDQFDFLLANFENSFGIESFGMSFFPWIDIIRDDNIYCILQIPHAFLCVSLILHGVKITKQATHAKYEHVNISNTRNDI